MDRQLYQIHDEPQPFKILTQHPSEVAMEWLASKENDTLLYLPTLVIHIENLSDPKKDTYEATSNALKQRDRERGRCGLPPVWEGIARELEVNQDANIRRIARQAEEDATRTSSAATKPRRRGHEY